MYREIAIDPFNTSSLFTRFRYKDDTSAELDIPAPQVSLSGKIAEGWRLTHPIFLDLKRGEDDNYIVSYDAFDTYGVGNTPQEAIDDFVSMLLDLYKELSESEEVLSAYLNNQFERLHAILSTLTP
jgi:hypothetical protein